MIFFLFIIFSLFLCDTKKEEETHPIEYYISRGDAFVKNEEYEKSVIEYGKAIELDPTSLSLHHKRGEIYFLMKDFSFSEMEFLKIVNSFDEHHSSSLRYLCKIYLLLGRYEEAHDFFQRLRSLHPEDDEKTKELETKIKKALGYSESLSNHPNEKRCLTIYPILLSEYSPYSVSLRENSIDCYLHHQIYPAAKEEIEKLMNLHPEHITKAYYLYGCKYLFLSLGFFDEGKQQMSQCIDTDPENRNCIRCFKLMKKSKRVLEEAEKNKDEHRYWNMLKQYKEYLSLFETFSRQQKDEGLRKVYNEREIGIKICKGYALLNSEDKERLEEGIRQCNFYCSSSSSNEGEHEREEEDECLLSKSELYLNLKEFQKAKEQLNKISNTDNYQREIYQLKERIDRAIKIANRKDLYKILGVEKKATTREIKKAYRKKAIEIHPDRLQAVAKERGISSDPEKMKELEEEFNAKYMELASAYEILSDDEKRARYDQGDDIMDIESGRQSQPNFGSFFGGPGGPGAGGFRFNFGGGAGQNFGFFR